MRKTVKHLCALLALLSVLAVLLLPVTAMAAEANSADTLKAAINGTDSTITLTGDFELGENIAVNRNVTIKGNHTITRAVSYKGTLFTVAADKTLTLDGGLTIDGNNAWTFEQERYEADMKISNKNGPYYKTESGAPVADKDMIIVNGNAVLNDVTITNHVGGNGCGLFHVAKGGSLTLNNGAKLTKNAIPSGSSLIADIQPGAQWTINEGSEISHNYAGGNGSLSYMKGSLVMNGGTVCSNAVYNGSGLFMLYSSSDTPSEFSKFTMNGGKICHNMNLGGGWGCMIYVHYSDREGYDRGGTFIMNGGTIEANQSSLATAIVGNSWSSHIKLNGGTINQEDSFGAAYSTFGYEMTLGKNLTVNGGCIRIKADATIEGTINGDLQLYGTGISKGEDGLWDSFGTGMTVDCKGKVTGDVTVGSTAIVYIPNGKYLGGFAVKDGGKAVITGGLFGANVTPWVALDQGYVLRVNDDGTYQVMKPNPYLTEGTYTTDVTKYTIEGYKVIDNGNGTWTVVKVQEDVPTDTQPAGPGESQPPVSGLPKTGDNSSLMLFVLMMAASLAGMVVLARRRSHT